MTIVEKINNLSGRKQQQLWKTLMADCEKTQRQVLEDILKNAEDTEIGKKYGFSEIHTIEEFQKRIPVTDYAFYDEAIKKMALAEENILFPGITEVFLATSGTTGTPKLIPDSKLGTMAKNNVVSIRNTYIMSAFIKNIRFIGWLIHKRINPLKLSVSEIMKHMRFYSHTSSIEGKKTEGGIDISYASGTTLKKSGLAQALAYPDKLHVINDMDAKMYVTMLFAIKTEDVLLMIGNNALAFKNRFEYVQDHAQSMIDDIKNGTVSEDIKLSDEERKMVMELCSADPKRAEKLQAILDSGKENFIPKNYWPYLCCGSFWLSGSIGVRIKEVMPYLPEKIKLIDAGYGASEAKINIPYKVGATDGILATCSAFYEFKDMETGKLYTAYEVEKGKEYNLIVTTFSGLYRYDMHDVVRVTGFNHNTPDIEFITKAGEILNVAQEKVPASTVVSVLRDFMNEHGLNMKQAQIYQNVDDMRYEVYFECDKAITEDLQELEDSFDAALCRGHSMYGMVRMNRQLNKAQLIEMKMGWYDMLYAEKIANGASTAQVKINSLIKERPVSDWIR